MSVTPVIRPPRVEKVTIITSFSTVNSSASASRAPREVFAQRSDLRRRTASAAFAAASGAAVPKPPRPYVGYGDYGARRSGHRILIGLIRGHFLLIFLLLFGIEIGEPQEKRRHDDNT